MTKQSYTQPKSTSIDFAHLMKHRINSSRETVLTPELQEMIESPQETIQTFNLFRKLLSTTEIPTYRNSLARTFIVALRKHTWTEQDSTKAIPVVDWLLNLGTDNSGAFRKYRQGIVSWANERLHVSEQQKKAWENKIALKTPAHWAKGAGLQAVNAIPFGKRFVSHIHD